VQLYRWTLKRHIAPFLGGVPLGNLDTPLIREWRSKLLADGVSPGMVAKAYRLLRAVLWTAVAELVIAGMAGHLLNRGMDSRLLMAFGFATMAFTCLLNADYTSAWAAENYFRSELLMGVGQVFAIFVIAVAAAEAAVGLGIILAFYRNKETVNIDEMNVMRW